MRDDKEKCDDALLCILGR